MLSFELNAPPPPGGWGLICPYYLCGHVPMKIDYVDLLIKI